MCSSPFLCSDQLIVEMMLSSVNSLTLHSVSNYSLLMHFFLFLLFLSLLVSPYEILFSPFFKDFEDLGFDMNPMIHIEYQFPAQYLPLADWLHAFPIFQLAACRFHGKYKGFDLISLIL